MNFYGSVFLLAVAVLLLTRYPVTWSLVRFLQLSSWVKFGVLELMIAGVVLGYVLTKPFWMDYTENRVVVVIGCLAVIEGLFLIFAESYMRRLTKLILSNYYKFAIPVALFLVGLGCYMMLWSYVGDLRDISTCESDQKLSVICDVDYPEDLVLTPDGHFFIAPQFGGIGPSVEPENRRTGRLSLVNIVEQTVRDLDIKISDNTWGDGLCERSKDELMEPHGIDLVQRGDGTYQLAVIDHYSGDSIEMFELISTDLSWTLVWRGCVNVPEVYYLNDVSLLEDGSFYVSHMYHPNFGIVDLWLAGLFKYNTGYVMRWDQEYGFGQVPGSEGAYPNGLIYDLEKELLYVAHTLGDRIDVLDMATRTILATFYLNSPDNLIMKDGFIWATSWDHELLDIIPCEGNFPCALPFSVYQLEPLTLDLIDEWHFDRPKMGMPTVSYPLDNRIWIGSAYSERIGVYVKR